MTSDSHSNIIISEIRNLAREAADAVGVEVPGSLFEFGQEETDKRDWYLVGLIGGKEVGKSALVNALVGEPITRTSSYGPGTEKVVAYVHRNRAESVRRFLDTEVPGRFEVIEHEQDELDRQALLDLPDIDSHYSSHFETVKSMLRFILFPIWIQSMEKYADRQPMDLLRKVVQGNAPENFLYCLNKADQLEQSEGESALAEIAEDYRSRVSKSLNLNGRISVYLLSAIHPERYDLPRLKSNLSKQKEEKEVAASRRLATRQHGRTLLDWIESLDLIGRIDRVERVREQLESLLQHRVESPIHEIILPSIEEDERVESFLFRRTFQDRIRRWPIVRLFDLISGPVKRIFHSATESDSVEVHRLSRETVDRAMGRIDPTIAESVQASFAHIRGAFSQVAGLYSERPLWEERDAVESEKRLRRALAESHAETIEQANLRLAVGNNPIGFLFRYLLVFGALTWFPFGQPVLEHYLRAGSFGDIPLLVVSLLGVTSLLQSALFLVLLFGVIWLSVRWRTQYRVSKVLRSLRKAESESDLGMEAAAHEWFEALISPLDEESGKIRHLEEERNRLEKELTKG